MSAQLNIKSISLIITLLLLAVGASAEVVSDNLSIGAGSDGSSKVSSARYGDVRDGNMSTYWSPDGPTGRISIKWSSDTTVDTVVIKEAVGFEGNIGFWDLVDHETDEVLASGSGAGTITFDAVSLRKIDFTMAPRRNLWVDFNDSVIPAHAGIQLPRKLMISDVGCLGHRGEEAPMAELV